MDVMTPSPYYSVFLAVKDGISYHFLLQFEVTE